MRGLHSPAFRHNLVSLGELQKRGIEVVFPAGTTEARCIDPKTGKIVWRFKQGPQGLYEAAVQNSETEAKAYSIASELHPTVLLHKRLGAHGRELSQAPR